MKKTIGRYTAELSEGEEGFNCDVTDDKTGRYASMAFALDTGSLRQIDESLDEVPLSDADYRVIEQLAKWAEGLGY